MRHKKDLFSTTRAIVQNEMAKPRMARSARIAELKLDTDRTPQNPSTTMHGTVNKIIPAPTPGQPEKAQIVVDGPDKKHRDFRIENCLIDEHEEDVKLKKDPHVEVTVIAGSEK
jgi:hypothetical protein